MFFHHYLMYISSELTMIDAIDAIRKQFINVQENARR